LSQVSFDEFKKLDIRIATVVQVERVPRTARLYKIIVDLGELGRRQTISSLVEYYRPEELMRIVFLVNLQPTKFGGEISEGMLLAAEKGDKLTLLTTEKEIENGANVT
jgi:methionyl-tRNA synthetase